MLGGVYLKILNVCRRIVVKIANLAIRFYEQTTLIWSSGSNCESLIPTRGSLLAWQSTALFIGVFYVKLRKIYRTIVPGQCLSPFSVSTRTGCYCANFTYTQILQLLPLVITSTLHNNKQDGGNIGVWDQFSQFKGISDLKYFNSVYKTHPDFDTVWQTY